VASDCDELAVSFIANASRRASKIVREVSHSVPLE
jgi:hypothetical protein